MEEGGAKGGREGGSREENVALYMNITLENLIYEGARKEGRIRNRKGREKNMNRICNVSFNDYLSVFFGQGERASEGKKICASRDQQKRLRAFCLCACMYAYRKQIRTRNSKIRSRNSTVL